MLEYLFTEFYNGGFCNIECEDCDDTIVEAWERMTFGGVVVVNERITHSFDNVLPDNIPPYTDNHATTRRKLV